MKHLHLDMVRVTEAAAISASAYVGRGDKIAADQAATDAMRDRLNRIDFGAVIAIGEGKKDDAPGLFKGDRVGFFGRANSSQVGMMLEMALREGRQEDFDKLKEKYKDEFVKYDIAVDPLDGTTQTAKGGPEAMAVLAMAEKGCLYDSEAHYMHKLAIGPDIASKVDLHINDSISRTIDLVSLALNKKREFITVCLLDRPRHSKTITELRQLGVRIKLISDCDVSAAIATAMPDSGIDIYMGVGGTPEGVIAAAALKCLRGQFMGQICDKDGQCLDDKVLYIEDLAKGEVVFCATGVTDGSLLRGVRYYGSRKKTHSISMRSESGTVRFIETLHGN